MFTFGLSRSTKVPVQGTYSITLLLSVNIIIIIIEYNIIVQVEKWLIRTSMEGLQSEVLDILQFPQKEDSYIQETFRNFAASVFINQKSDKIGIVTSTVFATFEFVDWWLDANIAAVVLEKGKCNFPEKVVLCTFWSIRSLIFPSQRKFPVALLLKCSVQFSKNRLTLWSKKIRWLLSKN